MIVSGGNFFQYVKRYCIDSITILIYTDNIDKIHLIIKDAQNIEDIKLKEQIYGHIYNLNIKKKVDYNNENNYTYNTLIIDNENFEKTTEILEKNINRINTYIVIKKYDNVYDFNYNNWIIEEEHDTLILKYYKKEFYLNNHSDILNYYELMYYVNNYLNKCNIDYFSIKSSCLGCIRNRSHIVFCDTIHICINETNKSVLKSNINNKIKFKDYDTYYKFILEKENISPYNKAKNISVKIHFYNILDNKCVIQDEGFIFVQELGNSTYYNYGPIRIKSLQHPNEYLKRIYGEKVFTQLNHDNIIIEIPKFVYDCYYNQWSSYTSDYWKNNQIENLYLVYTCLIKNKINCWIDCGTLLGAARNSYVCLFDDDNDIGILKKDIDDARKILLKNNICNTIKIKYVNNNFSLTEFYNLRISYNKKENLNYTFSENTNLLTEFRQYEPYQNKYVSYKDSAVSNAHRVPGLLLKRAVDKTYFDNITNKIKLGKYYFNCPNEHLNYLENNSRYGSGAIYGNPIRDCKPGNIVLYDDFR